MMRKSPDAEYRARSRWFAPKTAHTTACCSISRRGSSTYVEAAGVKSRAFTLKVVELPYVKQLDLEYHFPAYTGLEPRTVEDGGDVAALKGTDVRLQIQPTMATGGGRLVMADGTSMPLTPNADGTLAGSLHRERQRFLQGRARWPGRREGRRRRRNTPSTSWRINRRRSRCRSRAATPTPRRCRSSSSKRAQTTTSQSRTCSWCTRSMVARRRPSASSVARSR